VAALILLIVSWFLFIANHHTDDMRNPKLRDTMRKPFQNLKRQSSHKKKMNPVYLRKNHGEIDDATINIYSILKKETTSTNEAFLKKRVGEWLADGLHINSLWCEALFVSESDLEDNRNCSLGGSLYPEACQYLCLVFGQCRRS